ncbi:transporter [Phenylobacterium sp. LjRoot219]|uniref:SphA family protein n=1 Tax=Phenylobacterium sp. LjRoot219 TaxID=3342283 RepID=UPI003ECF5868
MRTRQSRTLAGLAGVGLILAAAGFAPTARASEGGASFYLLGSGGPGAGVLPPLPGLFLANTAYYYKGDSGGGKQFTVGGNVVAGLEATIAADFASVLSVPDLKIAGGTPAVGLIVPFGQPWVKVDAVITGPRGNQVNLSRGDTAFILGDPALITAIGWTTGKTHIQVANLLNVPIGDYRDAELANLAFNRWASDLSVAASWIDPRAGWDLSAKTGVTFNGMNPATQYRTGTEWHIEAAIEKTLSPAWSLGLQGYYFDQLTGDSGSGARLGPFKGRVAALGATANYNFKIAGKVPAAVRVRGFSEFEARNRLEGHSIFVDFNMPLYVKLPPGMKTP